MNELEVIKDEVKEIQNNFNPLKSTYRVLEEIIKSDDISKIHSLLLKIKGIDKYPVQLKNKYYEILGDVERLEKKTIKEKEEELKKKQAENTKELQNIIDSLEKRDQKEKEDIEVLDINNDSKKDDDVLNEEVEEEKDDVEENISFLASKKLFMILLILIIVLVIVGITIFVFY